MRQPPQHTRTRPKDRERENPPQDRETGCRQAACGAGAVRADLAVASDYVLPEATLDLLAGLVVEWAAKGAKKEAA